jgi:hypothetical protein
VGSNTTTLDPATLNAEDIRNSKALQSDLSNSHSASKAAQWLPFFLVSEVSRERQLIAGPSLYL